MDRLGAFVHAAVDVPALTAMLLVLSRQFSLECRLIAVAAATFQPAHEPSPLLLYATQRHATPQRGAGGQGYHLWRGTGLLAGGAGEGGREGGGYDASMDLLLPLRRLPLYVFVQAAGPGLKAWNPKQRPYQNIDNSTPDPDPDRFLLVSATLRPSFSCCPQPEPPVGRQPGRWRVLRACLPAGGSSCGLRSAQHLAPRIRLWVCSVTNSRVMCVPFSLGRPPPGGATISRHTYCRR